MIAPARLPSRPSHLGAVPACGRRPPDRPGRWMRLRVLGLLLAAITLAAACSEPVDEATTGTGQAQAVDQAPAEPADDTQSADADTAQPTDDDTAEAADQAAVEPADADTAEAADVPAGPVPVGPDTPGVSDDTVTISIIITDTSMVAQAFGWEVPD